MLELPIFLGCNCRHRSSVDDKQRRPSKAAERPERSCRPCKAKAPTSDFAARKLFEAAVLPIINRDVQMEDVS